jgi:sugar O-acyltransferase (sialic acid O-acetyltransferase NeuD family)
MAIYNQDRHDPKDHGAPALLVFPCNGNGLEALDCIGRAYRVLGFVDDLPEKRREPRHGHAVYSREAFSEWPEAQVLAVPGSPTSYRERRSIVEGLGLEADRYARVVHPGAHISPRATIGRNVLIMAGVVVTGNAVIGDHVCVLPNSVIHHDVRVGAWTLIGANVTIAGHVRVGEGCYIGAGVSVTNGVTLGDGCLVGLGSSVIRSVERGSRVAGCPAHPV